MTQLRDNWTEVGDRLEALALKLKLHTEEELSEHHDDLRDAWARVGAAVTEIAEALDGVAHDPVVRADVKGVADALTTAFEASLADARRRLSHS